MRILCCDDEELVRWSVAAHLKRAGHEVEVCGDGEACLEDVDKGAFDALVLDLKMPKLDGLGVLRRLRETHPQLPVVVVTAHGAIDSAIEATKLGARAYLAKPFDLRELQLQLERAVALEELAVEVERLRERELLRYERLVGVSAAMQGVFATLERLEHVDCPTVLITGESGTGKDLVAQAIHAKGPRKAKPYVEVDCAAIPETLIESELFGHEKGSFTDAHQQKRGLFEVARGGVIFLDEIGEMPLAMQAKLLRALENRKFRRVGGVVDIQLDAAIVAASNRDLLREAKAGRFREDLFFRLNVVPMEIPALRQRKDDIAPLVGHLLERTARELGRTPPGVSKEALQALGRYPWPGNVRELRNVIERVLILRQSTSPIAPDELPLEIRLVAAQGQAPTHAGCPFVLPEGGVDLEAVERGLIEQALVRAKNNQTAAAHLLGISRYALRYRLEKHGLKAAPKKRGKNSTPGADDDDEEDDSDEGAALDTAGRARSAATG
jgi:two-component system, NtrC family, response regulator AtoC